MRDWEAYQRGDKQHGWLGYETMCEMLLAFGYVESPGPQLIPEDQIKQVPPMPPGWLNID
jgi:hypothetical protein